MKQAVVLALLLIACGVSATTRDPISFLPLDEQIRHFQKAVRAMPAEADAYNQLAYAYIKKVRATADYSYSALAEKLLDRALTIDSTNYDSHVYMGLIRISQHQFVEARASAEKAIHLDRRNSTAYGVLGDACYELGAYRECADAYQKMIDLRPGTPSYSRIANYRRLMGDRNAAIVWMHKALRLTDPDDPETQAWCLWELGNLTFVSGRIQEAEAYYSESLRVFPNYYKAIAGIARVKAVSNEIRQAISLYEKAIALVPMPEFVASLGDLYALQGQKEDAERQYALVEYIGLISQTNKEVYNRQLALFYADHNRNLEEALALVRQEIRFRKDVYGYDALAWCLYKNRKYHEAEIAMIEALKENTDDPVMLFHAGLIFEGAGYPGKARKYLQNALSINDRFHPIFAKTARAELQRLESMAGGLE